MSVQTRPHRDHQYETLERNTTKVLCPKCQAKPGTPCRALSTGRPASVAHRVRFEQAVRAGFVRTVALPITRRGDWPTSKASKQRNRPTGFIL